MVNGWPVSGMGMTRWGAIRDARKQIASNSAKVERIPLDEQGKIIRP